MTTLIFGKALPKAALCQLIVGEKTLLNPAKNLLLASHVSHLGPKATVPLFTDVGINAVPTVGAGVSVLTVFSEDNSKQVTFASIPSERTRNSAVIRVDKISEIVAKYIYTEYK